MNKQTRSQLPTVTPEMLRATAQAVAANHSQPISADLIAAFCSLYDVDQFNAANLAQSLQSQGAISWDAMSLDHLKFFETVHESTRAQVLMLRAAWMAQKGIKGPVPIGKQTFPNTLDQALTPKRGNWRIVNVTRAGAKTPTFKYARGAT